MNFSKNKYFSIIFFVLEFFVAQVSFAQASFSPADAVAILHSIESKLNFLSRQLNALRGTAALRYNGQVVNFSITPKPEYNLSELTSLILTGINNIRTENSIPTIAEDKALASVATSHSFDQVADNISLTNPNLVCQYPFVRHNEFDTSGFTLADRYDAANISYRVGGENIAMVPLTRDVYYERPIGEPNPSCKDLSEPVTSNADKDKPDAELAYKDLLSKYLSAEENEIPAVFISQKWKGEKELADEVVSGWMNSPGHRANILRPEYNRSGLGFAFVNDYIIITHDFAY